MPQIQITKDERGKMVGFGQKGERAYARFLSAVRNLEYGEMLAFSYKVPRSPKLHRLYFVTLAAVFEAQEQFNDSDQFRKWAQVGAGHCEFVPGPSGRMVALPLSVDYESLDDVQFSELYEAVKVFLRSDRATAFLWGHLSDAGQIQMITSILEQFEGDQ